MNTILTAVYVLGLNLLACIAGIVVLALHGATVPDVLSVVAGGSVTAIAALLTRLPAAAGPDTRA